MRLPAALIAFVCLGLFAQTESPQVIGHVIDAVTGRPVVDANITLYTFEAERYRAVTDDSGAFRINPVEKGQYEVAVEKFGFVLFAEESLLVGESTAAPSYTLPFVAEPKATLRGRILDSHGMPLANAAVDLIRGPSLTYRKITDADGRFLFDKLGIGGYKIRAAPPSNHTGDEVATYFPSSLEESSAQHMEIQGDAEIKGFQLATVPVVHVRGIVRYEDSRPAANVVVKLLPIDRQPAHVVVSFDSTFLAVPEGDGTGPVETELQTDAQGAFDFASVRKGSWQIVAQDQALSGSTSIVVTTEDVTVDVRLKPPATISSVPILWAVVECVIPPNQGRCPPLNSRRAASGVAYPVWFSAIDGQQSVLRMLMTGRDSTSDLASITPGRFVPISLPTRASPALPGNAHLESSSSFPYIREIDSRAVARGQSVELDRGSRGLELAGGGYFDGDGVLPRYPMPRSGRIRGTVVDGAGVFVVIAHEQQGQIWGQFIQCEAAGAFTFDAIGAGDYGMVAFRNMDLERLRDPVILQRVLTSDKVRVSEFSTTDVRITQLF